MTTPLRDVWADTLIELADTDARVLVLDADLATSTKAEKFARAHPGSFYEMGIAEQGMVGTAVGLASMGYVPWLSSFAVFFTHRAVDQVRMAVAQTNANVKIGAAYSGVQTGFTGKTHLDVQDLTIMRAMPGMTVLAPADATECAAMVRWATATPGPVYLRLGREGGPDVVPADYAFVPGRVIRLRDGSDVLLVSTGQQSGRTLAAAESLATDGIDAGVLHVPCLKPVDTAAIAAATADVPLVVTTEEHTVIGGLGSLVAEIVTRTTPRRVEAIGIEDTWGESAPNAWLLDRFGLTAEKVAERVRATLAAAGPDPPDEGDPMSTWSPKDPNDIGVAFLGAGRMGQTHVRNMSSIPNVRTIVVADPNEANAVAGRNLARAQRASTDPVEAIHDPEVEVVVISTPTDTHAALIETALRAGKAVWSEKPIAQDIAETRRVVELWREVDIPVQLGFMRRFDPGYLRAKELIDKGELGRIEQFRALSRDTFPPPLEFLLTCGGSFLDMAVHDLDLARFLVGEVEEVHAWASVLFDDRFAKADDWDTSVIMLKFRNGALGVVETSRHSAWGYDIRTEVAGAKAKVVVDGAQKTPATISRDFGWEGDLYESFPDRFADGYKRELEVFFADLAAGRMPKPGPDDALETLRLAVACTRSWREGRPVKLDDISADG